MEGWRFCNMMGARLRALVIESACVFSVYLVCLCACVARALVQCVAPHNVTPHHKNRKPAGGPGSNPEPPPPPPPPDVARAAGQVPHGPPQHAAAVRRRRRHWSQRWGGCLHGAARGGETGRLVGGRAAGGERVLLALVRACGFSCSPSSGGRHRPSFSTPPSHPPTTTHAPPPAPPPTSLPPPVPGVQVLRPARGPQLPRTGGGAWGRGWPRAQARACVRAESACVSGRAGTHTHTHTHNHTHTHTHAHDAHAKRKRPRASRSCRTRAST
jgi:hypothetical protein